MTYEKIVEMVKKAYPSVAEDLVQGHKAIQLNVSGEGEGALYVEVEGSKASVEPYEYYDNDAVVFIASPLLLSILDGSAKASQSFNDGAFYIQGDATSALQILDAVKVPTVKKAASTAKKAAKKVVEEAKPVVDQAVKATKEAAKTTKAAAKKVADEAKPVVDQAAKTVKKTAKKVAKEAKPVVDQATETVKKTAKKVADETVSAAKSGAKAAKAGAKAVKDSILADQEAKKMPTGTATEVASEPVKTEE